MEKIFFTYLKCYWFKLGQARSHKEVMKGHLSLCAAGVPCVTWLTITLLSSFDVPSSNPRCSLDPCKNMVKVVELWAEILAFTERYLKILLTKSMRIVSAWYSDKSLSIAESRLRPMTSLSWWRTLPLASRSRSASYFSLKGKYFRQFQLPCIKIFKT